MPEKKIFHATLIELNGKGILLQGKSQTGKSDLALRLINRYNAVLVADDIVIIENKNGILQGYAPNNLAGLLEIRGLGIVKYPYKIQTEILMSVHLVDSLKKITRMPKICKENILGLEIMQIDLYAKEDSAPDKILAAFLVFTQERFILGDNI